MRLVLHLDPNRPDVSQVTVASALPGRHATSKSALTVEIGDSRLHGLVQSGESSGGFGISAEWILSEAECASVSHYSVVCRQTVPESDAAYRRNHDLWAASRMTPAGGATSVRLMRGVYLSQLRLKPKTIAGIGEWMEAYLAGAEVWQVFGEAELTGVVPEKVFQVRSGTPFPDAHQLFTETKLPPMEFDLATSVALGASGLLCYHSEELAGLPDFMHTAEPWANARFGWPLWVVSARVRDLFRKDKVRGWAFHPVLMRGSTLHRDYLALCGQLLALMGSTQHSRLVARTW